MCVADIRCGLLCNNIWCGLLYNDSGVGCYVTRIVFDVICSACPTTSVKKCCRGAGACRHDIDKEQNNTSSEQHSPQLHPLQLLLLNCVCFRCCSPTVSTCDHTRTVQSISTKVMCHSLVPPPNTPLLQYTHAHTHTHTHTHTQN